MDRILVIYKHYWTVTVLDRLEIICQNLKILAYAKNYRVFFMWNKYKFILYSFFKMLSIYSAALKNIRFINQKKLIITVAGEGLIWF